MGILMVVGALALFGTTSAFAEQLTKVACGQGCSMQAAKADLNEEVSKIKTDCKIVSISQPSTQALWSESYSYCAQQEVSTDNPVQHCVERVTVPAQINGYSICVSIIGRMTHK